MNKCLNISNNNNLSKELTLEDKQNNSPDTLLSNNYSNKNKTTPKEIDLMPSKYIVLGVKSITELPNNNFNNIFNTNNYNTDANKSHSLNKSVNKENISILSKANSSLNISNSNYKIKRFRKDNQISESSDEIDTEKLYSPTQGEMSDINSNNFSFYNRYGVYKNIKFNNRVRDNKEKEEDKQGTSELSNKKIIPIKLTSTGERKVRNNEFANKKNKNESLNINIIQSNSSINKNTASTTKRNEINNEDLINQSNKDINTNINDKNIYKEENKLIFLENKDNQKEIINNVKSNDCKDYDNKNSKINYNDNLNDESELELANSKGGVINLDMYNISRPSNIDKNKQIVSKDFNSSKLQESKINISYLHEQMYSNNLEDNKITIPNQINTSFSDLSDYSKKKSYKNNNYNSENTIYSIQKTIGKNELTKCQFESNKNNDYKICSNDAFEINSISKINKTERKNKKEVTDDSNVSIYEDTNSKIENNIESYKDEVITKLRSARKLTKDKPITKNPQKNKERINKKNLHNLIYDYSDKRLLNSLHKSFSNTNLDFYQNKTNSTSLSNNYSINPYALEITSPNPRIPRSNKKILSPNHKKLTSSLSNQNPQKYQINEYSISYSNKAHEKIYSSKDLNVKFSPISGLSLDSYRDLYHTHLNSNNLIFDDENNNDLSNYSKVPNNDIKYQINSPQMLMKSSSSTNISSANSRLHKMHARNPSWSMVDRILTDENIKKNKNLNYEKNNINKIKNINNKKMSDIDENDRIKLLQKYGVVMNNDDNQMYLDNSSPEENYEMNDDGIINNDNNPQANQTEDNENQELKNDQNNPNTQNSKVPDDNQQRNFNYIYHYSENPYYNIDISPSISYNYKANDIKSNSINNQQNEPNDTNKYKDNKLLKSNITQKFLNKKYNSNIICISPTDFHYGTTFHPGQSVNSMTFNMSKNSNMQSNTNINKNKNKINKNKQDKNLNNNTKKDLINFQHGKFAFEYSDIYHKLKSMEMNNASQEGFFDNTLNSKGNTASNNFFSNTHNLNYSNNLSGSSCGFNGRKNNTMPCKILNNKLNNEDDGEEYAKMYSNLNDFKRKKMY